MSMTITYDGTVFDMSGANTPDADLPVSVDEAGGVRRNYYGTATNWQRYRKHVLPLTWTGVSSTVLGSIQPLSTWTGAVYGTGFDSAMFGATAVNWVVETSSYSADLTGLNSYTVSLTLMEK